MTIQNVAVIRDRGRMTALIAVWDALARHPNADRQVYDLTIESHGKTSTPVLLATSDEHGAINALIIGRQEPTVVEFRIGYTCLFRFTTTALNIVYGGVLGTVAASDASAILRAVDQAIRKTGVSLVKFSPLPVESALYKAVNQDINAFRRQWKVDPYRHFVLDLPKDFNKFLERLSAKHRSSIRRYRKKLDNAFPEPVTIVLDKGEESIRALCGTIERVAATTYQRGMGRGFFHNTSWERRLTIEAERGALRVFIMYSGSTPLAFWIFVTQSNVAHSVATGYQPSVSAFTPGTLLLIDAVETFIEEALDTIDWGLGYADYKQRFSNREWLEAEIAYGAPSVRGVGINLIRSSSVLIDTALKGIFKRFGLIPVIKKRLRQRLRRVSR